jgi:streptogramin lyase
MPSHFRAMVIAATALGIATLVVVDRAPAQLALRHIVQAEMPARPNSLAVDGAGDIWLALQGDPPSLGRVNARECAEDAACEPEQFLLPDDTWTPQFVAVGRNGRIWLSATRIADGAAQGMIYGFDPETAAFEGFPVPVPAVLATEPGDIAVDSRGTVWFVDRALGIWSLNPRTGDFRIEYQTPEESLVTTNHLAGLGITVAPDNAVWCTCGADLVRLRRGFVIGLDRIVGVTFLDVWPIPAAAKPHGIVAESSEVVWLIDQHTSTLHRFDRTSAEPFTSWSIPPRPGGKTTVDPHWLAWRGTTMYFTGFVGVLGTFNTRRETFGPYLVSPSGTGPFDIAIDRVGRVWFTETSASSQSLSRVAVEELLPPPPIPDF